MGVPIAAGQVERGRLYVGAAHLVGDVVLYSRDHLVRSYTPQQNQPRVYRGEQGIEVNDIEKMCGCVDPAQQHTYGTVLSG